MNSRSGIDRRIWTGWLLPVLFCAGCSNLSTSAGPGGEAPVFREGDFRRELLLTGELKAGSGTPILVPPLKRWQATIRWLAADGVRVRPGDRVMELDTTEAVGDLEQKRADLEKALGELSATEAENSTKVAEAAFNLEKAKIALEKASIDAAVPERLRPRREFQEKLLAKARAETEWEKARNSLEALKAATRADLANRKIQVEKARREIAQAEEAIRNMTLMAPEAGMLVIGENRNESRKWQVGDTVWVGLEVMTIPDLTTMKVRAWLSDVDDGRLAPGCRAICTMDTYPDLPVEGVVRSIRPVAKELGWRSFRRFFDVEIDLARSDPERMRPGMSVRAEVLVEERNGVKLVNRSAVDFSTDPPRLKNGEAGRRFQAVGPCNDLECVVTERPAAEGGS